MHSQAPIKTLSSCEVLILIKMRNLKKVSALNALCREISGLFIIKSSAIGQNMDGLEFKEVEG